MIVGFTCSPFDLLHAGHTEMLKECKGNCDYLIVGLNANPCKNGKYPVQSLMERFTQLSAVKYVDEIVPYESEADLVNLLQLKMPGIRFVGQDYMGQSFTGDDLDIDVMFNKRQHTFSSRELKERVALSEATELIPGHIVKDNEQYKVIDNTNLKNLTLSTTSLKPNQKTNGHSHEGIEEIYTFLSGEGIIEIDGMEYYAEAAKSFTIKDGVHHQVFNKSSHEDLVFVCAFNNRRSH